MNFLSVPVPEDVRTAEIQGDFREAERRIEKWLNGELHPCMRLRLEYEKERIFRIRREYGISLQRGIERLKREIGYVKEETIEEWIRSGALDCRNIDGKMRCFNRFVDNLAFAEPAIAMRRKKKNAKTKELLLQTLIRMSTGESRKYRITAGIRLKIRKKYEGEKFRVWLPLPQERFQSEKVRIIASKPQVSYISTAEQRTAYFETREREINMEFEYEISEVSGGLEGEVKEEHKGEKLPHIAFTPYIKSLAERVAGDGDTMEKARRIYNWVTSHMRYFYVRNYGTYDNIGEYAAVNLRGDCGFHAILFIALCRAVGIPAKWQSGWFITPYYAGPHDWAQVFVNGEWYPVDASFGNLRRHTKVENEFYFGNLDAFRMIANDDILSPFNPRKMHWRSDPVDNQVGEVETDKNLYYGDFSWKIYFKDIKKI